MTELIDTTTINRIFPEIQDSEEFVKALNDILPKYDIISKERIAAFLSQCGHESGGFTKFKENLNYSSEGLCKTFKKKFPTLQSAKPYQKQPEKIANYVYANKNGNGSVDSGDGWKFKGRGCIQLTGRNNYEKFSKFLGKSLDETVLYCETLDGAIESACYFWKINDLNKLADTCDVKVLTKAINGGYNGLIERTQLYSDIMEVL